jgi:uncharacterized protein with HEPN domain
MPPDERDLAYLWDMLYYCQAITVEAAGQSFSHYCADENFRLAIERRIEIVGEAAARVSSATRDQYAHVPWRAIIAQRNVLAHAYGEIDDQRVWNVVVMHIPQLVEWLKSIVE